MNAIDSALRPMTLIYDPKGAGALVSPGSFRHRVANKAVADTAVANPATVISAAGTRRVIACSDAT